MTKRVGIISANWGVMAHLPAWRAVPGVEVVGICTSRQETAEAAATRTGIPRAFWDAQAMIADPEIDIVDVGTRPSIRLPMALAALEQGKHVYQAIPFAVGLEPSRSLYEAWKASSSTAIVDAYSQWLPAHRRAKEMLDENYLGRPFGGTCHFNLSLFNRPHPMFPYNWFAEGGHGVSALRNLGSHALHMLLFLFGPVAEVVADDHQLLGEWVFPDGSVTKAETNDFAALMLRFESGLTLQMQVSWNAPAGRGWYLDVFGSEGRMAIASPSFPTPYETTLHAAKLGDHPTFGMPVALEPVELPERLLRPDWLMLPESFQPQASIGMAVAMKAMIDAIEGNGTAAPGFEQAWQVERVQEAARISSAERRWVRIDEIG